MVPDKTTARITRLSTHPKQRADPISTKIALLKMAGANPYEAALTSMIIVVKIIESSWGTSQISQLLQ